MRIFAFLSFVLCLLLGSAVVQSQELAAGAGHTCAVVPGGDLHCWGWDEQGQLGDTAGHYSIASPVRADNISGVTAIDGGYNHTCAVGAAGVVKCWGYNRWGQLGDDTGSSSGTPVTVVGIGPGVAVGAGGNHSCALLADGTVWCWGHGYHGQLGTGTFIETDAPVQVLGVSGASALAVGDYHACAIVGTGAVKCWGRNQYGQLGNTGTNPDPGLANAVDVFGIDNAIALSAGTASTCALIEGGGVRCWGHGGYGTLGDGAAADSPSAVTVVGIDDAVAIVGGDYHYCVQREDGSMSCWGYNYFGNNGDGSNRNNHATPVNVVGVGNVSAIAAGSEHSCARVSIDPINVKCWGHGQFGQLGDGGLGGAHEHPQPAYVLGGPLDIVFGGGDSGDFE